MSHPLLKELIAKALNMPPDQVLDNASTDTLEAWDSLAHLDIILLVEQTIGIQFKTSDIPNLISLEKIEEALRSQGWKG